MLYSKDVSCLVFLIFQHLKLVVALFFFSECSDVGGVSGDVGEQPTVELHFKLHHVSCASAVLRFSHLFMAPKSSQVGDQDLRILFDEELGP